jgi:hypothetical protein
MGGGGVCVREELGLGRVWLGGGDKEGKQERNREREEKKWRGLRAFT